MKDLEGRVSKLESNQRAIINQNKKILDAVDAMNQLNENVAKAMMEAIVDSEMKMISYMILAVIASLAIAFAHYIILHA